jgi:putative peptidoglycan lipid II flippase
MAAFVFAFTIPNLLRALFGEGAFASAFVPVFTERLEKHGHQAAWQAACRIISCLAVVLAAAVVLGALTALALPSFLPRPHLRLAMKLLVPLMPYALLVCLAGALGSVLTALRKVLLPAYSPALLNICLILAALAARSSARSPQETIFWLAWAVLAAGILQVLAHLGRCRLAGYSFRWGVNWQAPEVRQVGRLLTPVLLGVGVLQLNTVVDRLLAAYLGDMAQATLYYSQRLAYLPVGLFGVAMGAILLPELSRAHARDDVRAVGETFGQILRAVVFLSLPVVAALLVLREPLVRLLFERGQFTIESRRETIWALLFYLPGVPAFVCAKVAVTPFHAAQDTRTPLRIALVCLVLNVVLNLILMQFLRQGGLALATSICSWLNVVLLLSLARQRMPDLSLLSVVPSLLRCLVAATGAGVAGAYVLKVPFSAGWGIGYWQLALQAGGSALAMGVIYLGLAALLGSPELRELRRKRIG